MNEDLLAKYNAELAYIRRMGEEFSEAYPSQATSMGLGAEGENDPFVGRMIESFALLNARTRQKLEDGFPELCGSMLELLYPHYQRPIPSMSVVECRLSEDQSDLIQGHQIPAKKSEIITEAVDGEKCRYRTCYDVECWPLEITTANYQGAPITAPLTKFSSKSVACLSFTLASFDREIPLSSLTCQKLRFFISAQPPYNYEIYEQLMRDLVGVVVTDAHSDPNIICLDQKCVQPVGFADGDALMPCPSRSLSAYRILTEYFTFREKYLFFDLHLGNTLKTIPGSKATLHFLLKQHEAALESQVIPTTFRLGCTPIVNLYATRADQLRIDHRRAEYPVVVDSRRPDAHEIYSVDQVTGTNSDGDAFDLRPFYAANGFEAIDDSSVLWHNARHNRVGGRDGGGTDVSLTFVDPSFREAPLREWTVDAKVTCLNRNLPNRLPTGPGRPRIEFEGGNLASVLCVMPPTPTRRQSFGRASRWHLLSHLNLNHLSLADEGGLDSLRSLLRLYDYQDNEMTRQQIAGIEKLTTRSIVRMVPGPTGSVPCRGLSMALELAEESYNDGSSFLLASVLDRFFALYAGLNCFTETTFSYSGSVEEPYTWPVRIGANPLT